MMDRAPNVDFLAYRISKTDYHCIEGWTGEEWIPDCWVLSDEDAVVHLLMNRNEGSEVELTRDMIEHTLHILKCNQKHIEGCIKLLEAALK